MNRLSPFSRFLILIVIVGAIFFFLNQLGGGASKEEEKVRSILASQNYTNIQVLGYGWGKCGNGDIYATNFSATAPSGKKITGCVCSGFMKGHTVRFDWSLEAVSNENFTQEFLGFLMRYFLGGIYKSTKTSIDLLCKICIKMR